MEFSEKNSKEGEVHTVALLNINFALDYKV